MPSATPAYVTADGVTLYMSPWYGAADRPNHALYVHGGPGSNSAFAEQRLGGAVAESATCRVAFYDQRGCGRSPWPDSLSHDDNVCDLLALCKALFSAPCLLIAHSYGSMLAVTAAALQPERFAALVLVSPIFDPRWSSTSLYLHSLSYLKGRDPAGYAELAAQVAEGDEDLFTRRDQVWDRAGEPDGMDVLYWFDPKVAADQRRYTSEQGFSRRAYELLRPALFDGTSAVFPKSSHVYRQLLGATSCSVHCVRGREDVVSDCAQAQLIDLALPGGFRSTVEMDNCGHFPHLEQPAAFLEVVAAVLGSNKETKA